MYAPKLRFMTDDERWAEGFAYRIDVKADAALAEIKAMADKARSDLCPVVVKSVPKDDRLYNLQRMLMDNSRGYQHQFADMQNLGMNGGVLGTIGGLKALGNPFGY